MVQFKNYKEILEYSGNHPFDNELFKSIYEYVSISDRLLQQFAENIMKEYFSKTQEQFKVETQSHAGFFSLTTVNSRNRIGFDLRFERGCLNVRINDEYADASLDKETLKNLYKDFVVRELGVSSVEALLEAHLKNVTCGIVETDLSEFKGLIEGMKSYKTNNDEQIDETITAAMKVMSQQFVIKINNKIAQEYDSWVDALDKAKNATV